jgi:hypothetical protein
MSRRAGGSSAGSTEPPEEDAVDGVGEAADRAVRRWKEMGEERFGRWGRARRWVLERTWSGQVAAAAAVDAMDGGGGGGFLFWWLSAEQVICSLEREKQTRQEGKK